ncbi:MAG: HAD-IA family hydrolase [Pyrobaculum sp.]
MYVFDLDGTLVESVDAHIAAWVEALRAMGVEARAEDVAPLMGLPARDIARFLMSERAEELAFLKNKLFLEKHIYSVRPYEDSAVLAELPKPIAVVTSSSGYVARRVLELVGLMKYVDLVVGGDEVPRGKPAPDPLYVVERALGVPVREMTVVGDSDYDMEMAKAAGARAVCIARRRLCKNADIVVTKLYELVGTPSTPGGWRG